MDFRIKTSIGMGVLLLTSLTAKADEIFYVPSFCPPEQSTLFVTNKTKQPQRFWTQVHSEADIDETVQDIDAGEQMKVAAASFLKSAQGYSVKSLNAGTLQFTVNCQGEASVVLSPLTTPEVSHYLPAQTSVAKLHLLNLFLGSQTVTVRALDAFDQVLQEQTAHLEKSYDTQDFKFNLPGISRLEVVGEERLHSLVTYFDAAQNEKQSPGIFLSYARLQPDASKTYFLVSTKTAHPDEGFVIALSDEKMIATAREQIQNPQLEKIVVGGIELGNGGFNRAFMGKDRSPYSWSVNRVDAFADFAYIDCDGSPNLVEERLSQRMAEGGRVCFWSYRVVRELSLEEVASGKLKTPPAPASLQH
jgi:hypothetical protein